MSRVTSTTVEGPNNPLTFTALSTTDRVTMCQAMLPSRMQCTKPGKFLASNGYQYCGSHALQIQAGLTSAPLNPIPGTGTVEFQPAKAQAITINEPNGETITISESGSAATPNEGAQANGSTGNSTSAPTVS